MEDEKVKALKRIARRGGFRTGAGEHELMLAHRGDLRIISSDWPPGHAHEIIDLALRGLSDTEAGKAIKNALTRSSPGQTLGERRFEYLARSGVSLRTLERLEERGAALFIDQIDLEIGSYVEFVGLRSKEQEQIDKLTFELDLLKILTGELIRFNRPALRRADELAAIYNEATSWSGSLVYSVTQMFEDFGIFDDITSEQSGDTTIDAAHSVVVEEENL